MTPAPVELVITQVNDHVKMRLTSQFHMAFQVSSKNYLNVLMVQLFQYLLYYHQQVFPVIFILDLNDLESVKLSFGSFL